MNQDYMREIPAEWKAISRVFAALSDEHRRRIVLTFDPGERLNVAAIVAVSPLSRTAVSHHLKILHEAGVLESVKEGKAVYFWIAKGFLIEAMETVLAHIRGNA